QGPLLAPNHSQPLPHPVPLLTGREDGKLLLQLPPLPPEPISFLFPLVGTLLGLAPPVLKGPVAADPVTLGIVGQLLHVRRGAMPTVRVQCLVALVEAGDDTQRRIPLILAADRVHPALIRGANGAWAPVLGELH